MFNFVSSLWWLYHQQNSSSAPEGSDKMKEIALAIQEGAQAYLNRQYITISLVGILIALLLFYLMENHFVSIGFVIGAFLSGFAGYIGMFVSVRANVRTTQAATESIHKALIYLLNLVL